MGILGHWLSTSDLLTPLFPITSQNIFIPLRRIFRKYLFSSLPHPLLSHALCPSMGCIRNNPRGTLDTAVFLYDRCVLGVFCDGDIFQRAMERQD
jgi:hypothetical protein